MRRPLTFSLLVALLSAVLVALPTVTPATAQPRPVPPTVERIPLSPQGDYARASTGTRALLSLPRRTRTFSLMGVTWRPDPAVGEVAVEVRHRSDGRWSDWETVEAHTEDAPDAGSAELAAPGVRAGTAPIWTGPSDGVQVRVAALSGAQPQDVSIELVDPGTSPADAATLPSGSAHAEEGPPVIVTRAQWGADESIRRGSPSYTGPAKVGFIHHTASSNDYTAAQAAAMVRGIYAYHVKSNGWSDIGYNYLVDRFGRAYEGRAGGLDRFVAGAHTGGFNKDSTGVSLLGDFSTVPPSAATLDTLTDVLAWKLGAAYAEPLGKAVLTSAGGGTSKFPKGEPVTFDVVSGHRDAGNTSCPGATTYARMGQIRQAVSDKLGVGFVSPALAGTTRYAVGSRGPVVLSAGTRGPLDWTVTVGDSEGRLLLTRAGRTAAGATLSASWDLTDAQGQPVEPGTYVVRLSGSGAGDRALPYAAQVVVRRQSCRGTPMQRVACRSARWDGAARGG